MSDAIEWREARLAAIRDLAPDIRLFEIAPAGPFVAPSPGSNIKVTVEIGGRPDTRSYSVVGPCRDGLWRIAVKRLRDGRGGSAYMWSLAPGARLVVATPANHFGLMLGRPEYLLVAGGIGITPIHGMALALAERGARFRLLYGVRRREDMAFAGELAARLGDRLEIFVGAEGGRIELATEIARLAPGGELYVCGPMPMLEEAKHLWHACGRPAELLRFETFGSGGRHAAQPFTVHIPRLGREIAVPQNQSMLDALESAGIQVISDCRRGECGLCALSVLEVDGLVDHRDVFFSDEEKAENQKLCACVSRVVGRAITIDTADRAA
ncbi:MAG TPA: PDR/VanB family oxidoreductase [Paracoccaceae bacterium]|nr:PDR/VanB family oxidoreductase [Paracoccaceae bacterium]